MKVLFTNPPWWENLEFKWGVFPVVRAGIRAGSRWPFTFQSLSFPGWRFPLEDRPKPFFMAYAASYARKATGADITLRDSIVRRESYARYFDFVGAGDFDFIFFESATPSWEHDRRLIRRIHQISPKSKLVLTGPITNCEPDKILSEMPVVACIKGEYEKGSVQVLEGVTGVIEHQLLTASEMNAAPWPMFDEFVATRYLDRKPVGVKRPHAQVWSSRGCPYKCIFCVWPATMTGNDPTGEGKRSVRYYSSDYLEPYLRHIIDAYGFRSVYFDDDTFNLGTGHTVEMCQMMKRIGLPWSAMCRADTIKMETWDVMKESGCYGVKLGFESGNQYVVDKIVNKHLDLAYAKDVVRHLRKLGMTVHGTFTIGLPGETPEQMRETLDFIRSIPLNSHQLSGTAEIEGTPLHRLRTNGKLKKYEAASVDENYTALSDGRKKLAALSVELQNR